MTQELDVEGLFWLEGTENKVAGRLTYDMHSGPELHLIGSFHPDNPLPDRDLEAHVHGIANGKEYTPGFPILGVFWLIGQPKRDGSIIVRSYKASQSPVYPIRDAILAVNHASCPSLSSPGSPPVG